MVVRLVWAEEMAVTTSTRLALPCTWAVICDSAARLSLTVWSTTLPDHLAEVGARGGAGHACSAGAGRRFLDGGVGLGGDQGGDHALAHFLMMLRVEVSISRAVSITLRLAW